MKLTFASELSAFAVTIAGASGIPAGVTLLETSEGTLVPILFVAVTVNL